MGSLFDPEIASDPQDLVEFLENILQASTQYSIIGAAAMARFNSGTKGPACFTAIRRMMLSGTQTCRSSIRPRKKIRASRGKSWKSRFLTRNIEARSLGNHE